MQPKEEKEKLLYTSEDWDNFIGPKFRGLPVTKRLHLAFSLLVYLQISLTSFLMFIFESEVDEVSTRASRFMGYTPSAISEIHRFPAGTLFRKWHSRYPKSIPHLHDAVLPCAIEVATSESNTLINMTSLKIKLSNLTLRHIQEIFNPGKLIQIFQEAAPFTWNLLFTFASLPNKYRRQKDGQSDAELVEVDASDPTDWEDNPNVDDEEHEGDLKAPEKPAGFRRNPSLVVLVVLSMLIFARNQASNLLPLILGLFFKINDTSARVMSMLSNIGLCVSGKTVERLKKRISDDAIEHAIELMLSGRLFATIFDNINIYLQKFQQRITNRNEMIHATNYVKKKPRLPFEVDLRCKLERE